SRIRLFRRPTRCMKLSRVRLRDGPFRGGLSRWRLGKRLVTFNSTLFRHVSIPTCGAEENRAIRLRAIPKPNNESVQGFRVGIGEFFKVSTLTRKLSLHQWMGEYASQGEFS